MANGVENRDTDDWKIVTQVAFFTPYDNLPHFRYMRLICITDVTCYTKLGD